jgi:hypothetical protein
MIHGAEKLFMCRNFCADRRRLNDQPVGDQREMAAPSRKTPKHKFHENRAEQIKPSRHRE